MVLYCTAENDIFSSVPQQQSQLPYTGQTMNPQNCFANKLTSGQFVLTGEVAPPKGADLGEVIAHAEAFSGVADAINVTDNQRAVMRMGNLAVAVHLVNHGLHPILQMTCRDRNSIGLQSSLLAAHALGVRSILALTGDPIKTGDHPEARSVFELSSVELLRTTASLNCGQNRAGLPIASASDLFVGAACDPGAKNMSGQLKWMEKKADAGARFFQTQAIYNPHILESFVRETESFGVPILAGVLLLKSARMARFLNEKVPGVTVPDALILRLEQATNPVEEGVAIGEELMHELAPFAKGLHVMSVGQELQVAETLRRYRHDYLNGVPV